MDPNVQSTTYTYQPLAHPTDNFRLVELFPASSDGIIRCNIVTEALSQNPVYEALSYEWGSPEESDWIEVDSIPFRIRHNLYLALERIRPTSTGEKRRVFIDALCINQSDVNERNHQVQIMGWIYYYAQQVLAWLGQEADNSDLAFDLFDRIYKRYPGTGMADTAPDIAFTEFNIILEKQSRDLYHRNDILMALNDLFCRSYWNRVWIVQELMLARSLRVFCGSRSVPWEGMNVFGESIFGSYLSSSYQKAGGLQTTGGLVRRMALGRWNLPHRVIRPLTLEDLIMKYRNSKCSLLHDHIYAFLGLASDCTMTIDSIQTDYSSDLETLFFDTLRFCKPKDAVHFARVLAKNLESWHLPNAEWTKLESKPREVELMQIGILGNRCHEKERKRLSGKKRLRCFEIVPGEPLLENGSRSFEYAQLLLPKVHCVTFDRDVKTNDRILWICGSSTAFIFRNGRQREGSSLVGGAEFLPFQYDPSESPDFPIPILWESFAKMKLLSTESPWIFRYTSISHEGYRSLKGHIFGLMT